MKLNLLKKVKSTIDKNVFTSYLNTRFCAGLHKLLTKEIKMRGKIIKSLLSYSVAVILAVVFVGNNIIVESDAAENGIQKNIQILINAGYSEGTAEALNNDQLIEIANALKDNPNSVSVSTSSMEVDFLEEVEALCSYTDKELVEQGATLETVKEAKESIKDMYDMSAGELKKEYKMDKVEAELFKDAVESGEEILEGEKNNAAIAKKTECEVSASGSITKEEMEYTQTVVNNSTKKKPVYNVTLSYKWKSVYTLAVFKDEIVAGWGGGLNVTKASGKAKYYDWKRVGGKYGSYVREKSMSKEETIQSGMEFIFPQSVAGPHWYSAYSKTKQGTCSFKLSQTKFQGYNTKVISRYCHRVIAVNGFGIGIDASGASVSLNIGGAWDKTSQKSKTIKY